MVEKVMDYIAKNTLKVMFLIMLIVGTLIKPMYDFGDFPYFTFIKWYDLLVASILILIFILIYQNRDNIQSKINYKFGFIYFMIIAIIFIVQVPLIPFSDMKHVYEGAINFSSFHWYEMMSDEYWSMFPVNTFLSVFWGILLLPFPKMLIIMKIINALLAYGIIFITSIVCKEYQLKYYKVIYFMLLVFVPIILYINHVYYDIPIVFFCILSLYLFKKTGNVILVAVVLGIAGYLRDIAAIFLLAVIFAFIFTNIKKKLLTRDKKIILIKIIIATTLFVLLSKGSRTLIKSIFLNDDSSYYPAWNQFYIGLNEAEFGFMDNDFSYERDFEDITSRVNEYGFNRISKIICKKTLWLWMQGTYQAQRYGFGSDVENTSDKFEYETVVTKYILNDGQSLRMIINSIMRTQYLILFTLMVCTLWKKKDITDMRELYYILIATFLIMLVYELKSRYIFHCLPIMTILACWSLEYKR